MTNKFQMFSADVDVDPAYTPRDGDIIPIYSEALRRVVGVPRSVGVVPLNSVPAWGDYYFFSQCKDGSGSRLSDQGLNLNHGTIAVPDDAWSETGKFSTVESAAIDQAARLADTFPWNKAAKQSTLLFAKINGTAPAAATEALGNSLGSTGLRYRVLVNGGLQIGPSDGTNSVFTSSSTGLIDGSEHSFVLGIDGVEDLMYLWYDGEIDPLVNGIDVSSVTGSTISSAVFGVGSAAANDRAIAATYDALHFLILSGDDSGEGRRLPSDMAALLAAYEANPERRFTVGQLL